jgi:predicted kinase
MLSAIRFKFIDIEQIWKRLFTKPAYSVEESTLVFKSLLEDIEDEMKKGTSAILVEGVLASENRTHSLIMLSKAYGYKFFCLRLITDLNTAIERNIKRNLDSDKNISPNALTSLNSKLMNNSLVTHTIDTTYRTTDQVFEQLKEIDILNNGE